MPNKPDIKKMIASIKGVSKKDVTVTNMRIDINHGDRDMRQDAMDLGAHGAKDMWGGSGDSGH